MPLNINTTPPADGEYNGSLGNYRIRSFRRRVTITHGQAFANAGYLPSNVAQICWATLAPGTGGVAVTGGLTTDATNAANSIALTLHPTTNTAPLTAPASTSSSSAATNVLLISTGTTTTVVKGPPITFSTSATNIGQQINTNSSPALLLIQPANTNSQRIQANGTNAMVFGTSTATSTTSYTADLWIYYWEVPSDTPSYTGGNV